LDSSSEGCLLEVHEDIIRASARELAAIIKYGPFPRRIEEIGNCFLRDILKMMLYS
jgi:hypothetical protein